MLQLGMIGLGRMGGNMVRRLRGAGVEVHGYDRDPAVCRALHSDTGMQPATAPAAVLERLEAPRKLWLMLPAGAPTEAAIEQLSGLLEPGDILIDGANSHYRHAVAHARRLEQAGVHFVDAGVSGGIWGLHSGYGLMIGGSSQAVSDLRPILSLLAPAPDRGWLHCGPSGSGHFVKMVHNGIEYGLMQAYAEGFNLLRGRPEFDLDLAAIAESWRHGSVIRSWLLDLTADLLGEDASLESVAPYVGDSGEGRWTAQEAILQGVPAPVITLSLMMRLASQGQDDYSARLLAMMRNAFGGHSTRHQPTAPER